MESGRDWYFWEWYCAQNPKNVEHKMTLSSRQVIISPKIMLSVAHGNASDPSPEHLSTIETNRFVDTIGMVKDKQIHCQISGCGNGEYARHWAYAHSNIESHRIGVLIRWKISSENFKNTQHHFNHNFDGYFSEMLWMLPTLIEFIHLFQYSDSTKRNLRPTKCDYKTVQCT